MQRWIREQQRRCAVAGFAALAVYVRYMGSVDRIDKTIKYANIRLHHCAKRRHRSIFFWVLGAVWNNILVVFVALYEDVETLEKTHEGSVGF